jgi:hypothetical protein
MKTFDFEKARAEAQAAEERRMHESMLEKQAVRLALMFRHNPLDKAKVKEAKAIERELAKAIGSKNQLRSSR